MFAALVSSLNNCPFCAQIHTALAGLRLDAGLNRDRVLNWREQGLEPRLAAGLGLVEAMTTSPDPLGLEHVRQARGQGLCDSMIADALHVAFVFNLINRIANALGFDWKGEANAARGAVILDRMSYKVPRVLLS